MAVINGNLADGKPMQVGGWYNGQQWDGSKLSAPGTLSSGEKVSNEVIAQTNKNNVQFIEQQRMQANQIQSPVSLNLPSGQSNTAQATGGLQGQVDIYRKQLDETLAQRKAEADKQLEVLKKKEEETLAKAQELSTPFRQELETKERERLYVNKNFEDNQKLVDELDQLLTEGNQLLEQQKSVTGLAAIRNPRIQKTMEDISARAGVIQAVMSARNSQISVAENMIDRSINAIAADRQDQLSYYETVLSLNRQDMLSLDKESKDMAQQQIDLIKNDLTRAQDTADYVKKLLIDPATAKLMGQAGVSLNDSVEQINAKIENAQYANEVAEMSNQMELGGAVAVINPQSVPANQLRTLTDSRGVKHYYKAEPGTFGVPGGNTVSERAEEQRQQDMQRAQIALQNYIKDNPDATKEQLALALRAETSLSEKDIKLLLEGTGFKEYSEDDLINYTIGIIDQMVSQYGETEEGKQKAIEAVRSDKSLNAGQKATAIENIKIEYPTGNWFTNLFK